MIDYHKGHVKAAFSSNETEMEDMLLKGWDWEVTYNKELGKEKKAGGSWILSCLDSWYKGVK